MQCSINGTINFKNIPLVDFSATLAIRRNHIKRDDDMIIVLKPDATQDEIENIVDRIKAWGMTPSVSRGTERTIVGIIGDEAAVRSKPLDVFPGVESVMSVVKPYKLASSEFSAEKTKIAVPAHLPGMDDVVFGGDKVVVMAGPCSVESLELLEEIATGIQNQGAHVLRGGAFKPRTSPYSFQGLGEKGLSYLAEIRAKTGMPIITEVMDTRQLEKVAEMADILQIGARNMQNFNLLKDVGQLDKPVMIKRGLSSTIEELLMSAEYVLSQGNKKVILCERGIRTFEKMTRNTLDVSAVPVLKRETHLPVVVDPSHATGHWDLVAPVALAAVAAGADGLMVEVHPKPSEALSDGSQALLPATFERLMRDVKRVAHAVDRSL